MRHFFLTYLTFLPLFLSPLPFIHFLFFRMTALRITAVVQTIRETYSRQGVTRIDFCVLFLEKAASGSVKLLLRERKCKETRILQFDDYKRYNPDGYSC